MAIPFHERIIRNTDEMNHIAEYIENNVAKWDLDKLNKTNNVTIRNPPCFI